jgi:putative component of membrane protein insertase Oxa1/YidC/SpoIIIJ protein YidD
MINIGHTQNLSDDLNNAYFALNKIDSQKVVLDKPSDPPKYRSELKFLMHGSVWFYQDFISSQDDSYCNFAPSCSHYAQEAISSIGILKGIILTSDRLQRCNGSAYFSNDYVYDITLGKFLDPVNNNEENE